MNSNNLHCPKCGKGLFKVGRSKVVRIHPVARLIQNHHTAINLGWAAFSPVLIYWMTRGQSPVQFRSLGYAWAGLLFLPSLVMFFLIRFFPLYRITDCPYCGHYELKKLGKSHSA